jgi:hypothetical protein
MNAVDVIPTYLFKIHFNIIFDLDLCLIIRHFFYSLCIITTIPFCHSCITFPSHVILLHFITCIIFGKIKYHNGTHFIALPFPKDIAGKIQLYASAVLLPVKKLFGTYLRIYWQKIVDIVVVKNTCSKLLCYSIFPAHSQLFRLLNLFVNDIT